MQNDELISKAALKKDVRDVVFAVADMPLSNDPASKLIFKMGELLAKQIDDAPGVDAEPVRHGKWSPEFINGYDGIHPTYCCECSACKKEVRNSTYFNYCPNCGAKMMDGDV